MNLLSRALQRASNRFAGDDAAYRLGIQSPEPSIAEYSRFASSALLRVELQVFAGANPEDADSLDLLGAAKQVMLDGAQPAPRSLG